MRQRHVLYTATPLIVLLALDLSLALHRHYISRLAPAHPNIAGGLIFVAALAALGNAAINISSGNSASNLTLTLIAALASAADFASARPVLTAPTLGTLIHLLVRPAAPARSLFNAAIRRPIGLPIFN